MKDRFAGRGLDKLWFWFCVLHIPITLLLDLQALYPPKLIAHLPLLTRFLNWYLSFSRDPIIDGAVNNVGGQWNWLRVFFWLEACFQVPCFFLGAWGLWRDDKRVYPLLLAYGASTTTTLLPVLSALFTTQINPPLSPAEMGLLLNSYVPFLILPLALAVDMATRIVKIMGIAQARKMV